ncbi:MAG: Flp family type IVb pilin [Aquiluna sp.]|nr:Flp family type IVb pilin [Aquiluna sp.]MCF8546218.1 Flp family type IVb pilin [Aquiluna sp.]
MLNNIKQMIKSTKGASAVEYALIIALIAAVIGVGIAAFGSDLNDFFDGLFATLGL